MAPNSARRGGQAMLVRGSPGNHAAHEHRTAKIVELVSSSKTGFEDAIRCCLEDARESTRGITGAHVQNLSVKCVDGRIVEYKVNLNVSFGIERTPSSRPRGRRSA